MPPTNLQCFEQFTGNFCGFFDNPFGAVLKPIGFALGDVDGTLGLGFAIMWGILLGILWIRTENLMLVSIVGLLVASTTTAIDSTGELGIRGMGLLLVGVSIGITLFQLIKHKIQTFA